MCMVSYKGLVIEKFVYVCVKNAMFLLANVEAIAWSCSQCHNVIVLW